MILGIATVGFVLTTRGAAKAAEASDEQLCNRDNSLCDLRLDQVTFPGVHHAFASPDYPGYLFAQQTGTITDQLNAGVRAVNIDTHYGVPSAARIPGEDTPIVLTDKVGRGGGPERAQRGGCDSGEAGGATRGRGTEGRRRRARHLHVPQQL